MAESFVWNGYSAGVSADVAGPELKRIARNGELDARAVVDAARPEGAPLHPAFEWDDAVAAEEYRATQARYMIRALRIVREESLEPERVFWHVATVNVDAYVTTARVVAEPDLHAALMEECVRDLLAIRKKYSQVKELAGLWHAIDEIAV